MTYEIPSKKSEGQKDDTRHRELFPTKIISPSS